MTLDKLAAARFIVARRAPYMMAALLLLVPRKAPGLGTFAVSETGLMLYDPEMLEAWTNEQVAAVYFHEAIHILQNHAERRRAAHASDHRLWNVAADCEINDDLAAGRWSLPGSPALPSVYGLPTGQTAEAYYAALMKSQKSQQPQQGQPQQGQQGQPQQGQPQQGQPVQDGQPQPWGPRCGSGAGGEPMPGEDACDDAARTPAEIGQARRAVAAAVTDAAKSRGTVPGCLARWAEAHLAPPKVAWQTLLSRSVRRAVQYRAGLVDYSYRVRSSRQAGMGAGAVIMPGLHAPIPEVAIVVDTSGSMSQGDLQSCISEVQGVLATVGAPARFVSADARVQANARVVTARAAAELLRGGGGTNFRPAFEALDKARPRPTVIIYATDGHGRAPAAAPRGISTIWLLVGRGARTPAPWGDVVRLDEAA